MANDTARACGGNKPRWYPSNRRVIDANAFERDDRLPEVGDARLVNGSDLALGGAMSTGLRALEHARHVLGDRICCDEAHLRSEAVFDCEPGLVDRRFCSERRLDSEGTTALDPIEDEALTLLATARRTSRGMAR
jgi:hypothetical protein